jgi:hypothetical protein
MTEATITSLEASKRLGVHVTTVTRWCQLGKLAGARLRNGSRKLGWQIPALSVMLVQEGRMGDGAGYPLPG